MQVCTVRIWQRQSARHVGLQRIGDKPDDQERCGVLPVQPEAVCTQDLWTAGSDGTGRPGGHDWRLADNQRRRHGVSVSFIVVSCWQGCWQGQVALSQDQNHLGQVWSQSHQFGLKAKALRPRTDWLLFSLHAHTVKFYRLLNAVALVIQLLLTILRVICVHCYELDIIKVWSVFFVWILIGISDFYYSVVFTAESCVEY